MGAGLSSWHLTFYVLVSIAAGAVVSDEPAALQRGARGVLVVAYALVGRHAVDEDRAVAGYGCLAILSAATVLVTLALLYRLREFSEPATGIAFQMLLAFVFPILMGV